MRPLEPLNFLIRPYVPPRYWFCFCFYFKSWIRFFAQLTSTCSMFVRKCKVKSNIKFNQHFSDIEYISVFRMLGYFCLRFHNICSLYSTTIWIYMIYHIFITTILPEAVIRGVLQGGCSEVWNGLLGEYLGWGMVVMAGQ